MTGHDRPMTVSEAADVAELLAALPWPLETQFRPALRVLIDHARTTSPADPAPTSELRACFGVCDHVDCLP